VFELGSSCRSEDAKLSLLRHLLGSHLPAADLQHFSHVVLMLEATKEVGLHRGQVDVDAEGIGLHLRGLT
jgi:hypothetical protein